VVIHDFDLGCLAVLELEYNAEPIIDPYTVISRPIPLQHFQTIAGWNLEIRPASPRIKTPSPPFSPLAKDVGAFCVLDGFPGRMLDDENTDLAKRYASFKRILNPPEGVQRLVPEDRPQADLFPDALTGGPMDCPKCRSEMEHADIQGVRVSRCLQCRGLWFSGDGHLRLRQIRGSGAIDIGDAEVGKAYDDAESVPCPICSGSMEKRAERSQPHIVFEACGSGHGVFFDAAEYRDFAERTFGDLIRRIF
jgi:Zn-finger nucleic acid-binding protein